MPENPSSETARKPSWAEFQTAVLANALTAPFINADKSSSKTQANANPDDSRDFGNRIVQRLKKQTQSLINGIDQKCPRNHALLNAVQNNNIAELARLGIDVNYARINQLATALIQRNRIVEIETVGPYAAHHVTEDGQVNLNFDTIGHDEKAGIQLAALLRNAFHGCDHIRIVALVDDFNHLLATRELTQHERDKCIVEISKVLYEEAVLWPTDIPGREYLLLRESVNACYVDELIELLRNSQHGTVETNTAGDIRFQPNALFVEQLGLKSANRRKEINRTGVLLKRKNKPTCQAMDAAGFLHPTNKHIIHAVMLDNRFKAQQEKTRTLLMAIGIITTDSHHNIFYDAAALSSEAISLSVLALLCNEMEKCTTRPA